MSQTILCRIGFCQKCFDRNYPQTGQKMLLLGSHGFHVDIAYPPKIPKHPTGYVPHLYKFGRPQNDSVVAKTVCCMDGCDVTLKQLPDNTYNFLILDSRWKEVLIPINDWNALTKYKRDLDYVI